MKSKKAKSISISDKTWELAKKSADKENRSLSNYISNLILKDND